MCKVSNIQIPNQKQNNTNNINVIINSFVCMCGCMPITKRLAYQPHTRSLINTKDLNRMEHKINAKLHF